MSTNAGFSAAKEYFGSISGLQAKESSDGLSGSVAEAANAFGDTIAHDEYAQYMHPSVTYAVTGAVSTLPALGSIVTYSTGSKKFMVTQIAVTTSAGQAPTLTISGEEVPSTITEKRTYAVSASVAARCKAQDVASAFTAPGQAATWDFTSITTTWSVDFVNQSVAGVIVAACATHGRVEANATITDPSGSATLTAASGWTITSPAANSSPDEGYVTLTATATKWITGTEAQANGGGGASA